MRVPSTRQRAILFTETLIVVVSVLVGAIDTATSGDERGPSTYIPKVFTDCDCPAQGDVDTSDGNSGAIDSLDAVFLVEHVFRSGDYPPWDSLCPTNRGDLNCDGEIGTLDCIRAIDIVLRRENSPCNPCACDPFPTGCPH